MTEPRKRPPPGLRWPLTSSLDDPVDEPAVERMWCGLEPRLARLPARGRRSPWLAAAALLLALVLVGGFAARSLGRPMALLTDDGRPFSGLVAPPEASAVQRFADGSWVEALADTRLAALASTPTDFGLLLERGTVRVSVTPGGPRRWVIEAKLATVEVVGTRFSVGRTADRVDVAVEEGVVLVRSALLPEGVARLDAGAHVRLPSSDPTSSRAPAPPAPAPDPSPEIEPSAPSTPSPLRSNRGPAREARALLHRADEARLSGDLATAERLLDRLVREHPHDSRAALAAFTLGTVRLKQRDAVRALEAFRLSLALGASAALKEDCYLRLVETELAAGHPRRARSTALEYEVLFPNGRHRARIAALLPRPPGEAAP